MILHPPFQISSRLLPSLVIEGVTISIERRKERSFDNRDQFNIYFDFPIQPNVAPGTDMGFVTNKTEIVDDFRSGCGGGTILDAFKGILDFLCNDGENDPIFKGMIHQWAMENRGEIEMCSFDIGEGKIELIEE